jgi:uncharacterized protein
MLNRRAVTYLCGLLLLGGLAIQARAESLNEIRNRTNHGVVSIVSGGVDGTYIRFATDLAAVLDNGDQLRVLPLVGKGSLQNIADILFLKGVDIGIVQSDALAYAKQQRMYPGVEKSIQYIAKLYNEEVHVLSSRKINSIEQLSGQKVNVDVIGSGTAMTASLIFDRLRIPVTETNYDQALALEKLKRGEIAALVYVAGKPARLFRDIPAEAELHLLPVPMTESLVDTYLPSEVTHDDYPALVDEQPVNTAAVGAVMAVYGWPTESERYRKVARFVDAFFDKFPSLQQPPRHVKWREVNLAAPVPGWARFPAADAKLRLLIARSQKDDTEAMFREFSSFIAARHPGMMATRDKEMLFESFKRWQSQQTQ